MRKLFQHINEASKAYLTFNYAERRGIMVLVSLILAIEGTNAILPALNGKEEFDFSAFEDDLRRFETALSMPDTTVKNMPAKRQYYDKKKPDYEYNKKSAPAKPPMMIEVNTADSAQLVELYGIGASYADRILKYRGLLGGFFAREQMLEIYGMDSARFMMFRDQITIDTGSIKKIAINQATFKDLLRHPYLDYETVKDILNYINKFGPVNHHDTLRKIIGYDPMFEKVKHYIEFSIMIKE